MRLTTCPSLTGPYPSWWISSTASKYDLFYIHPLTHTHTHMYALTHPHTLIHILRKYTYCLCRVTLRSMPIFFIHLRIHTPPHPPTHTQHIHTHVHKRTNKIGSQLTCNLYHRTRPVELLTTSTDAHIHQCVQCISYIHIQLN